MNPFLFLQVSNLKKILKGILDFYSEVLGQQIHDFHMPDVQAIGKPLYQKLEIYWTILLFCTKFRLNWMFMLIRVTKKRGLKIFMLLTREPYLFVAFLILGYL